MKKRLLALLLVLVMVLGMFPVSAMASTPAAGTVYISASKDGVYLDKMAYAAVSLSDLAKIKLSDYNMSQYRYDPDEDGVEEITMLHLFIYAQEKIYGGSWKNVVISGAAGSMFVSNGLFGFDQNLNYYHNGKYPVQEDSTDGATADQLVLKDGDFVDVVNYTSYAFYNDPVSGFHYFTNTAGEITHAYEAAVDEPLTVTLMRAGKDITDEESGDTIMAPVDPSKYVDAEGNSRPIYYGASAFATDASSAALNENGEATVTFSEAGTYYLWAYGGYGSKEPGKWDDGTKIYVVSSPAYAVVTVTDGTSQPSDGSWDGITMIEPTKLGDVYQIGTGAELAWFVNYYIIEKQPVSGVLTADINLADKLWVANTASGNGKNFVLDGQNHKITGLNGKFGFIGAIGGNSKISNLSVYGEVKNESSAARVGGIVGYLGGGHLENCSSYVNITATGTDIYAGGIVGNCYKENATITNCANYGDITCTGNYVGGIAGIFSKNTYIYGCYNEGNISGTKYVGGIVGSTNNKKSGVTGCYNTGSISGTQFVGGLIGVAKGNGSNNPMTVKDCYSTGAVAGTSDTNILFGAATNVIAANIYYLSSLGTDANGKGLTEAELKAARLDTTYFQSVCGEYPILVWQTIPEGKEHLYCTHDVTTTCEHCAVTKAPAAKETGILSRTCQNGCGVAKQDVIPTLATYTVTIRECDHGTVTAEPVEAAEDTVVTLTVTPEQDYVLDTLAVTDEGGGAVTVNNNQFTMPASNVTVTAAFKKAPPAVTVTVPAGSTVVLGVQSNYFMYSFQEPVAEETVTNDDGTVTYGFKTVPTGKAPFIRVQNPNGVTYWDFTTKLKQGAAVTITAEQIFLNSETRKASTVIRDFSESAVDVADVYLTANAQGYVNLALNETRELNVIRSWQIIEGFGNSETALPDVHYTVVGLDGKPSDVIFVTTDTYNTGYATLKANKTGTAIVLVSYDAVYTTEGNDSDLGMGATEPMFFSAIWPENTGVLVVSVDQDGTAVETNMMLGGNALDAEHDVLYYLGTQGASYSFTPATGSTVTVARSTVADTLSFTGFTADGVTAADGVVTVSGLTTGSHIIRVEKDGVATYQVIRAKQTTVTFTDADGKTIDAENPAKPGQTVTVQLGDLYNPVGKMTGIYNTHCNISYLTEDNVTVRGPKGTDDVGYYIFASNTKLHQVAVTIPETWTEGTYSMTGCIEYGGYGEDYGAHRTGASYKTGRSSNTNAPKVDSNLCALPALEIPVDHYAPAATHTVTFQVKKDGEFNSYVGSLKLYGWNGTEKGTELSLGEKVDGLYTVELEEGTYWVEGYDCKETQERLGGMTLTVTEDASYTIKHGAKIAVTNSGWVYGTDYTAAVTLSGPGGENRTTELGTREAAFEGITCIYADGDTITATFTALREDFVGDPAVYTVTPSVNASYQNRIQTKFVPKHTIKVTAPEGSVITGGYLRDYSIYEFVEPVETTATTASFILSEVSGGNIYASDGLNEHFVRVEHPDGVTYWMFGKWNADTQMSASEEDLHLNDTVTSSTVVRDFSNNALDLANIYLNINEKGFLTMDADTTKELNVWRTWQPIESINNAEIAVPEVHYTILKTDGTVDTSNSVISITPDANLSAQATLKAEGSGTAIVLVTYDAVTHDNAMIDAAGKMAQSTFSAIWPENTGVFVVTVGEGLELSMTMDRPSTDKTTTLDGEMDILFYTGDTGAEYTFAPGSGATVKVARSTITDGKLTFSGFTDQGVGTDESGNVTVSGLTTGRHIIQVTVEGKTAYQVITARQVTMTVTHEDGTEVTAENPAQPNETVTVQFTNLINPVEKIAGIYNNTTYVRYEAADGTNFVSGSGAFGGTYNFNSDPAKQRLTVTIPRYFEGTSYELVGSMTTGGYGEAPGGHRGYRYGTKGNNNQNRPSTGGDLCALPQLSIATKSVSYVNCTIVLKDGEQTLPLTGRTVKIYDVDGTEQTMGENGAISLPAGEYTYEVSGTGIRYAAGSFTVTAETTEIVLAVEQTTANAWDGSTETEPAKDSDGVYQISNGAELAWFVKNVAVAAENLSGVLTADIDLAGYPWTYANTGWSDPAVYTKLDGQNHTVSGLRGKVSFLSKLGSGSEIKNITVEGVLNGAGGMGGIATSATGTVLENCISRVEITATGGNVGGLVSAAKDVTIRSCANEGNITATGSANYLGGLVASGNISGYVVVENSRNDGNITGADGASYAGGILAALNGAKTDSRITGCINTGSVYTGNYAGGIVGYVTSKMALTDCYNTGAISAKALNYSGGIAGDFGGYYNWLSGADPDAAAQMTNCYSIDANASKAIVGNVWQADTVTFTNCVYLEGLNEDPNGTALSAAQLKAYAPEGSLFVEVCGGYPALSWETGKQSHKFCDHAVTETCEHCEYDPAPTADAVGTLKRHCQNEGCDAIKTEEVPKLTTYTVTLPTGTGFTAAAVEGSASPVVEGGSYSFTVTIADGYEKGEGFAVKANGTALTEADGIYTVSNIRANVTITVEGVEEITTTATWQEILANAQTYLLYQGNQKTPEVGSQNGEWQILGLARNDAKADFYDAYYENVVQYVKANINDEGKLNSKMSTDNSRVILALSALGKDVTNVGGYDLIKGLSNIRYLTSQGINGPVFALIALDSGDYAEPSEDLRATIIEYLLSKQLSGGGWGLESKPDDMTPMTIQALAPYYDTDDDVKAAVDKALDVMKGMVATTDNAETLAQMVVALSALKKDCETTEGFEDVLDKLLSFAVTDGQKGFRHVSSGNTNQMATEQSFYALVAYSRMKQGKTRLYDMTDVVTKQTKYSITIEDAAHGTVTASAEQAVAGTTITLTVEPETGFQLEKLTVTQEGGKAVTVTDNTFVMPEGNVTVKATFVQSENPAQDVMDAIDALDVTKADAKTQKQLEALENAYDNLSEEDQKNVTNHDRLLSMRKKFNKLLEEAKDDARDEVEQIVEKLDKKDYTEDNWDAILELVETTNKKIDEAENTDELQTLLLYFQWELEEVPSGDKITVTFRLIGDSLHDEASKHEEYVTWIPTTTYTMEPGSTMYDVFMQAIADNGMSQQGAANNYVSTIKAPSVLGGYWLGEFDNGRNSGWMYTVNGSHPSVGLCEYDLQDGDRIVWHYVDDYTVEEHKFTWLEAEDISPEEYVKKNGKEEADVDSFTDVNKTDWFYDDVKYVVENGLMNGTGDDKFSPTDSMNRAMLVTVLYRLEGEPKVSGTSEFTDVENNQWYTNAVLWATKNEIVNGYGDGKFGPTDSITREQMATILFRYATYKNYKTSASNSLTGYTDFSEISVYALKSLKWANAEGLITGRTASTLAPQGTATRAEVAAILHRFVENVVKG